MQAKAGIMYRENGREKEALEPRSCGNCGARLDGSWREGYCPDSESRGAEERALMGVPLIHTLLIIVMIACVPTVAQTIYSGAAIGSDLMLGAIGNAPLTYSARTDTCETGVESGCVANPLCQSCTGTGQPLTYLARTTDAPPKPGPGSGTNGQYLNGINTIITDPDFGTQMVRATDYSLSNSTTYPCGAGGNIGMSFNVGSFGGLHLWSSDSSKLLINNTGGWNSILAFSPTTMQVTPSDLCAGALGTGTFAFSRTNPHVIYELNMDQESTVTGTLTSGSFVTPETIYQCSPAPCSTGPHATVLAVNPGALIQIGSISGGTANGSTTWVGQTSGAVFSPSTAPTTYTYATTIYQGVINDSGAPSTWSVGWSLLFNLNYVSGLNGPYFPSGPSTCLPSGYSATYNGTFIPSDDDTQFAVVFSDNGQSAKNGGTCSHTPGGVCQGPIYEAAFKRGSGCRVWNLYTDVVSGDYGPTGAAVNGQANIIAGTINGTFAAPSFGGPGETLTQSSTGAVTELTCTWNGSNCATSSLTGVRAGVIYGNADGTHVWTGQTSGATITPTAMPVNPAFYFPALAHDAYGGANSAVAEVVGVEASNGKITAISNNAGTHLTTITSIGSGTYNAGQQILLFNLADANDGYLNCVNANQCPIWTVTSQTSSGVTVISDAVGTGYSYTESTCSGQSCPTFSPNGPSLNGGYGFFNEPWFWQIGTLIVDPCISPSCQGHSAEGYVNSYRGNYYTAHTMLNPSLPCTVSGPDTPCPSAGEDPLLSVAVPVDQHGTFNQHGLNDYPPVAMVTDKVCGQAVNPGAVACVAYNAAYYDEIVALQNSATNSSATSCNYGSGGTNCAYRLGHTFNTGDNWNFNIQNGIGNISPDGNWLAFPSTWGNTLGCMDGSTNCWGSYVASGPANASMAGATISTNASGVITVTMPNEFCAPNGNQYFWINGVVQTIACGALAEEVTLSGFAESWANQVITLTAVGGCDSSDSNAGSCTSFSGTGTGVPSNYGPVTETGTQSATPLACTNTAQPCQRGDIWIAKLTSAHP